MARKKVDTMESPQNTRKSPRISRKNISLTRQNEGKNVKSNSTVKEKKHDVTRSRKKEMFSSSTTAASSQLVEETGSPASSVPKKTRRKIGTKKTPPNLKKKKLLTEQNINVSTPKSDTTVKKKKICTRRSSGKKEKTVKPFQFTASPVSSCSKMPRKKIIITKSPRNLTKKKLLAERNVNENNEKSDCIVKKKKHCSQISRIRKVNEEIALPIASSSKKPQRKVLKTKSPRASRKRKLPSNQRGKEFNEESGSNIKKQKHCDLQSENKEDVNISSTDDVAFLREIISISGSSAEQEYHENNKENGSNMVLESRVRNDVVIVPSAEVVTFVKEIPSTVVPSAKSQTNYEVHETRCMICLEREESMFTSMPCGHSFHSLCLQTWFQVKQSCPVCNPEIPANGDVSINSGIEDTDESMDMNRYVGPVDYMKESHELHHIDKAVHELKKLNEDINEFLLRCVICMGTSRSPDQISDFELMPCSHNVHAACAQTSSGAKAVCPVCMENSRNEDDDIYEFPEEIQCAICLDTEEYYNFEYISCCHSFHHICIRTWFAVRRGEICPICMVSCSNAAEDEVLYGFLENVKCTICMDIEESSEFKRLSCRHSFHTMCAQSWFQENSYCPTCMRNVSTETDDEEDVRCVICVDTEDSSVFEFLSCCHSFHAVCIQSWLKKGKSCPICNTRILDASNTVEIVGCSAACN